jgi:CRP-like cAMP-binding protein
VNDTRQEASNELYESLSEEVRHELRKHGEKTTVASGTRLLAQGVCPAYVIIVDKGSVEVSIPAGGQSISLAVFGKGKVCGLRSVVGGVLPDINVTAREQCEVTLIPSDVFTGMVKRHPEMYFAIARVLSGDLKAAETLLRDKPSTRRRQVSRALSGSCDPSHKAR